MSYEVWDFATQNMIDSCETEPEALESAQIAASLKGTMVGIADVDDADGYIRDWYFVLPE